MLYAIDGTDQKCNCSGVGSGGQGFVDQVMRRLAMMDSADYVWDVRGLPRNRLETLRSDRADQYSIRTNAQWCICIRCQKTDRTKRRGWTITEEVKSMSVKSRMRPVQPGEILRDEIDAVGLSVNALSEALDVPVNRITAILNGQRGVTANTALRLARYFGTAPQICLNLQKTWELRREEIKAGSRIAERVQPRHAVTPIEESRTGARS